MLAKANISSVKSKTERYESNFYCQMTIVLPLNSNSKFFFDFKIVKCIMLSHK